MEMKKIVKYVVFSRTGRNIGNSYMHRVYLSIAGLDVDGRKVYQGHSPYIITRGYWAEHYSSGLNKRDQAEYYAAERELTVLSAEMTVAL